MGGSTAQVMAESETLKPGWKVWRFDQAEFIPIKSYDTWMTRGIPKNGDILFTMEAPLGYVAYVPDYKFALAQRIVVLRPNISIIKPRFLYWLMQSPLTIGLWTKKKQVCVIFTQTISETISPPSQPGKS